MRLNEKQRMKLLNSWGDWEALHGIYDELMAERLKELDEEFLIDLQEVSKGATFWYA